MYRIGTHCFKDEQSALTYFAQYGYDSDDVADKIDCNEIVIGEPALNEGESLWLDADGRYHIQYK